MHTPKVQVVADGRNGYIVRYQPLVGSPVDLRRFAIGAVGADTRREATARARAEADAYVEGFNVGLCRSVELLDQAVGAEWQS